MKFLFGLPLWLLETKKKLNDFFCIYSKFSLSFYFKDFLLFLQFKKQLMIKFYILLSFFVPCSLFAQCPTCGNSNADAGETNTNCPQDIPHAATCASPCSRPTAFETTAGIRTAYDFTGSTTWTTAGLPAGWSFAGAPSATTAGALPAADAYGAKAGLIQPNCSGSCTSTNGFCIGNLANSIAVGGGGTGGKLGANFDGRANVTQNLSYAVLRGQNSPTLVSETFNFSAVEGFKIQFWLFPSETSCGQTNSWGSCTGNVAFLDFSSNGGTSWTQIMQMDISSSSTDMCFNNSTNTKWITESSWSRVCITVFKTSTSPGNFYTAATGTTAASGMMVNSSYFTASFKFRVRYSQSASCTSGITTTNPGRYLAIDYPVITSGNQMIPCGISFSNMCGYGADANDDGVGGTGTSFSTAFGTFRRGVNQAERGVEIFQSQSAIFNGTNAGGGGSFPSDFDLCNAEGGDKQCIDWRTNNNAYFVVYECITDWEAASGTGINVNFYKGTTPQSFGLAKVTTAGETAVFGWRYSGSRFVSCSSTTDLNPGCNGYLFASSSLPTQFSRGFYHLAHNSTAQSWSVYGATSCSHYFNGPFFSPIETPANVSGVTNYVVCNSSDDLVFTGNVSYCQASSGFTGGPSLTVTGPSGFTDTFNANAEGTTVVTTAGDYVVDANTSNTPTQCIDCSRPICVTITQAEIDGCIVMAQEKIQLSGQINQNKAFLNWSVPVFRESDIVWLEYKHANENNFTTLANVTAQNNFSTEITQNTQFRLKFVGLQGKINYSNIIEMNLDVFDKIYPNPAKNELYIHSKQEMTIEIVDAYGRNLFNYQVKLGENQMDISSLKSGVYFLRSNGKSFSAKFVKE